VFGFNKKKEEPKKDTTTKKEKLTQSTNLKRKVGDEWIGEFSGTKVKFLYSGPVGEYPGWK
jgi:hypothetical protein